MASRVLDIGQIDGPLMLFGGPYSNLQATRALFSEAERLGIPRTHMICTGDVVAYCADPGAVWDLVSSSAYLVAGNCEVQLGSDAQDCGCGFADGSACDRWSDQWYSYAARALSAVQKAEMAACPDVLTFRHRGIRCAVIHGGATHVARYIWPGSPDCMFLEEHRALVALCGPVDLVIAGHCGLAFDRELPGFGWINAGAIGMPPHDGRAKTRFALMDDGNVIFHRLHYDALQAAAAMRDAGLPDGYADALTTGIWPSEDILPENLCRQARRLAKG